MAKPTKEALEKAYNAGHALPGVQWPDDAPDELRTPGPQHCPFSVGDPQRERWLEGLRDALGGPTKDPAKIIKQIDDELEVASNAG